MPVVGIWVCILRHKCPWNMSGIPTVSDALKVQITISIIHLTFCFLVGKIMIRGEIIEKKDKFYMFCFLWRQKSINRRDSIYTRVFKKCRLNIFGNYLHCQLIVSRKWSNLVVTWFFYNLKNAFSNHKWWNNALHRIMYRK